MMANNENETTLDSYVCKNRFIEATPANVPAKIECTKNN